MAEKCCTSPSGGERAQSPPRTLWGIPSTQGEQEPEIRGLRRERQKEGDGKHRLSMEPGERDRSEMTSGPLSESLMI